MKIAIAGKGGVGKTTLAALICWALKDMEFSVLAVDADPDTNLGAVLGFPNAENFIPIIHMKELIEERMEIQDGNRSWFKLNPQIDDIPDKFIKEHDGIKLIVMGTVKEGDAGCVCPENTFLKRLLHQVSLRKDQHIIVDFEAGLEHLGRGTASNFEHLIIVTEPTKLSLDTLKRIYPLAKDIGIKNIWVVANRVKDKKDIDFVKSNLDKVGFLGAISYSKLCEQVNQNQTWQRLKEDKIYQETKEIVNTIINKK